MKKGWNARSLGDLCEIIGGGTPPKNKAEYYSGTIPWATVRDMRSDVITDTECKITKRAVTNSSTNIIPAGNVVIATRVGLGKVCLLGQDTAINQDLRGIIPIDLDTLSVRFLYWWLKSTADLIVAEGTGATVQGVKLPFIKGLQVPLPSLSDQQRIVGVLDEAFEGIATAKANAERNIQNARALFEGHLHSVLSQHNDNWVHTMLGDVLEVQNGCAFDSKDFDTTQGMPLIRIRDLKMGTVTATRFKGAYDDKYLVHAGDLLIGMDGEFGCYEWKGSPALLNQRVCRLYRFAPGVVQRFLHYGVNSHLKAIEDVTGYATVKHLSSKQILGIELPLPPVAEQQRIVAQLDALRADTQRLVENYQDKRVLLDALRSSLLHQAFASQL